MTDRNTNRWRGAATTVFVAAAIGVLFNAPSTMLVAAVAVAYAAYASSEEPPPVDIEVRRGIEESEPEPGEEVTVTVVVENTGDQTIPDLRVVDGVPAVLPTTDGTPRLGTTLRPGAAATLSYTVEAARGEHEFAPATVIARNWSGSAERELEVEAATETPLTCVPELEDVDSFPLRSNAAQYAGNVDIDVGGEGIEFFATREYRRGDPVGRIDWNRKARTGELSTVEFREERSATVVLVIDTREEAYVSDPDGVSAIEYSVAAARGVGSALLAVGNPVGAAAFGPEFSWLSPSIGRVHRAKLQEHLALADGLSPTPQQGTFVSLFGIRNLERRMPRETQVVFFSPATDEELPDVMRQFEARGHAVTMVSPDVVGDATAGAKVAALERADRLRRVRRIGIPIIDWDPQTPLAAAVAQARRVQR